MTTVTIGANSYEIHGTEAGFLAYIGGHISPGTISTATALQRRKALITSARYLKRFETSPSHRWTGTPTVSGQALVFPRDSATCNGVAVADGTTPSEFITGEYELAIALFANPALANQLTQGNLVRRAKGGPAEVEFFGPSKGTSDDTPLPATTWQLVGCFMEDGAVEGPVVEGNLGTAYFESAPHFGLSGGYS